MQEYVIIMITVKEHEKIKYLPEEKSLKVPFKNLYGFRVPIKKSAILPK